MPENDEDFEKRLKAARDEYEKDYNPKAPEQDHHVTGANIGYEFLAYVISGGIVGYLLDKFAGTAPWGILAGFVFGLIGGVFRANSRMKQNAPK